MFDTIKNWFTAAYQKFWDWQKNAATILLARLTVVTGFVTSALSFVDWSPVTNLIGIDTGFNKTQVFWLGAIAFVQGIIAEITRRSNTVTVDNTLVSKDITVTKAKVATQKVKANGK